MVKKVLVTGGCGFLGSQVCEFYRARGAQVIAYDNLTKQELQRTGFAVEAARSHNSEFLSSIGVQVVKADVRDFEALMDSAQGCDYLIHTAAQPAMTIGWEDPLLDLTSNVNGTVNVLEAARTRKIPVACCATIHIYGNLINQTLRETDTRYVRDPEAVDETHPTLEGTLTPLHASKHAGDVYVKVYIDTYRVEAASFRLTGIYGTRQLGGEDHGWVANFAIRSVMGWPLTVFGTGKQARDILYATDVCEAFDAFYRTRRPGAYNIGGGPGSLISLRECIDLIGEINGTTPEVNFEPVRHGDLFYFCCDIAKARRELGWEPKIKPREGVEKLMGWIRDNRHLFSA
jgi:CDP-paratose 2-epimerase